MNRTDKDTIVNRLHQGLSEAEAVVLADYTDMIVAQANDLRGRIAKAGSRYHVVKNTLLKRAAAGTPFEAIGALCEGPTAVALGFDDPAAPARVLEAFIKDNPKGLKLKGGFMAGRLLDEAGVKALAKMPTLTELRAQLLGVLSATAQKLVGTIAAAPQQLVGVVQARIDKDKT